MVATTPAAHVRSLRILCCEPECRPWEWGGVAHDALCRHGRVTIDALVELLSSVARDRQQGVASCLSDTRSEPSKLPLQPRVGSASRGGVAAQRSPQPRSGGGGCPGLAPAARTAASEYGDRCSGRYGHGCRGDRRGMCFVTRRGGLDLMRRVPPLCRHSHTRARRIVCAASRRPRDLRILL